MKAHELYLIILELRKQMVSCKSVLLETYDDKKMLMKAGGLTSTFGNLSEASYVLNNREVTALLRDFEDAARDMGMRMPQMANIPSLEEVKKVFLNNPNE